MIRVLLLLLLPFTAQAETIRVATFNTELSRDGPGLLLRDIQKGDPQVASVVSVLTNVQPDIVALQGIDWDLDGRAMDALIEALKRDGLHYPSHFAGQPNSGVATGMDLDGDGKLGGPGDAQGWGRFTGQNGLAVLSRYPILETEIRSFSDLLWLDLPGAVLPEKGGTHFPTPQAAAIQRLSSTAHWVIPIKAPGGRMDVMTFHATPPVFDGPEDRNGLRNADEIRLWRLVMDGALGPAPTQRFVIAGDANNDPHQGEGLKPAIRALLADPRLQDPLPLAPDRSSATVSWKGVGELRVDYVLPSVDWQVADAGVYWPDDGPDAAATTASRHRLVWVDLTSD